MITPIADIPFPLTRCATCNGSGELHTSHSFECFTCDGVGYLWYDKPIPRGHVPNLWMTELVEPCCGHARDAHWKKAKEKLDEYHRLMQVVRHGQNALETLERMLKAIRPTPTPMP